MNAALEHALRATARRIAASSNRGDHAGVLIATSQFHGLIDRALKVAWG